MHISFKRASRVEHDAAMNFTILKNGTRNHVPVPQVKIHLPRYEMGWFPASFDSQPRATNEILASALDSNGNCTDNWCYLLNSIPGPSLIMPLSESRNCASYLIFIDLPIRLTKGCWSFTCASAILKLSTVHFFMSKAVSPSSYSIFVRPCNHI